MDAAPFRLRWACLLLPAAMLLTSSPVRPQPAAYKLTASDGDADDRFGYSVSISGDVAVVGAHEYDLDAGFNSGWAYVFRRVGAGWVEEQKLTASGGSIADRYGARVAVSGDVAVVGADEDDEIHTNAGAVYVYRRVGGSWAEEQKLTASDGYASDNFGTAVSVSGDVIFVGATGDDDDGAYSGSVYVFRRVGGSWVEEQKLTASDAGTWDHFGSSASVSGDVAVVGAGRGSVGGIITGKAYVFRRVGEAWVEEQRLLAPAGRYGDNFGGAVSVAGDVAVVGTSGDDLGGQAGYRGAGSAYVFRLAGGVWGVEQKLTAGDPYHNDAFGNAVSVSGDAIVVGASGDNDNCFDCGSAYVFRHVEGTWVPKQKLAPSDAAIQDYFGDAVSVSGDVTLVGAYNDDDNGGDSGSAYVYDLAALATDLVPALDPVSPPVVLPAAGGSFSYTATLTNTAAAPQAFDAWVMATLPSGNTYGPVAGPVPITLPAGATASRALTLNVPGVAPAGLYILTLNVGDYPARVDDADSFTFTKLSYGPATPVGEAPAGEVALTSDGALSGEAVASGATAQAPGVEGRISVYPNPAGGPAVVRFALDAPTSVRLTVHDALGREVAVLHDGPMAAGTEHHLVFDGASLPAGVYVVRATGETFSDVRVLTLTQ